MGGMFSQFFQSLKRQRTMDPLHVTMTGVRMGERFVQVGCDDAALLRGLAGKVGLSGASMVVALTEDAAARAREAGRSAGALIDVREVDAHEWGADARELDLVVIDDTRGTFARMPEGDRRTVLTQAHQRLRIGGRIEVVERVMVTGLLGGAITRPEGYQCEAALSAAGFRPVRVVGDTEGLRFIEGLRSA